MHFKFFTFLSCCLLSLNISNSHALDLEDAYAPFIETTGFIKECFFLDVDLDQDQDLLMVSQDQAYLYINDGLGNFLTDSIELFPGIRVDAIAHADVDGDYDPDLLIAGNKNGSPYTALYKNDGDGNFAVNNGTTTWGQQESGSITFLNIDKDLDLDVLITGRNKNGISVSLVYKNNGNGDFTVVSPTNMLTGVFGGTAGYADIDGDNDLDIIICGRVWGFSSERKTLMYKNDGNGKFTEVSNANFTGVMNATIEFGDVDNDGDYDLILAGSQYHVQSDGRGNTDGISTLFLNDGTGVFTDSGVRFPKIKGGKISFIDIDEDGDLDVYVSGSGNSTYERVSQFYENEGNLSFKYDLYINPAKFSTTHDFGDIDGDGDLDLVTFGSGSFFNNPDQHLYKNLRINDPVLSISNPTIESPTVFPTIAQEQVTISPTLQEHYDVRIVNTKGELAFIEHQLYGKSEINTSSLNNGLYIINIISGRYSKQIKFQIQR